MLQSKVILVVKTNRPERYGIRIVNADYLIIIFASIWLMICSWQDIKKKRVHVFLIGVGFFILCACSFLIGEITIWSRIAGLGLGLLLLLLTLITRGQIGIGDGLIVSIIGVSLGFPIAAFTLTYGLFASAVFSIGLILIKKVNKKATIPFIPFIFIGYLGVLLI